MCIRDRVLIDRIKIEKQYKSGQPTYPFPEVKPVSAVRLPIKPRKRERYDPQRQRQGYNDRERPQPPFSTFDPPHLDGNRLGAVQVHLLECLLIHAIRLFSCSSMDSSPQRKGGIVTTVGSLVRNQRLSREVPRAEYDELIGSEEASPDVRLSERLSTYPWSTAHKRWERR